MAGSKKQNIQGDNDTKKEKITQIQCTGKCKEIKTKDKFFKSNKIEYEDYDGYCTVCKECLRELCYSNNQVNIDGIKMALQYLDKPFLWEVYHKVSCNKWDLGTYTRQLNRSQYKGLTFKDSDKDEKNNKSEESNNSNSEEEIELDGIELQFLQDKWGEDLPIEQLIWMNKQYDKWEHDYAIDNEFDDSIVEQIIFEKWYIKKDRQEGKPVDKRIETLNKLFKLGNFKKRSAEDSEVDSIAEYIAEWEKGKPFLKESKTSEFQDPDNFIKLGIVLAGAIGRTIGKSNQYVEEFEDYYKNVTMDLTNLNNNSNNGVSNDKS